MTHRFVEKAISGLYREAMDEFEEILSGIDDVVFEDITTERNVYRISAEGPEMHPVPGSRRRYSAEQSGAHAKFSAMMDRSRAPEGYDDLEAGADITLLALRYSGGGDEELFRTIGDELDALFKDQHRAHVLGPHLKSELDRRYAFKHV